MDNLASHVWSMLRTRRIQLNLLLVVALLLGLCSGMAESSCGEE